MGTVVDNGSRTFPYAAFQIIGTEAFTALFQQGCTDSVTLQMLADRNTKRIGRHFACESHFMPEIRQTDADVRFPAAVMPGEICGIGHQCSWICR